MVYTFTPLTFFRPWNWQTFPRKNVFVFKTQNLAISGVLLADKCPIVVGKESAKILAVEEPELGEPNAAGALIERPSLALLFKKMPDKEGDIIGK